MINCFNFITTRIDDSQWRQRATDTGGGTCCRMPLITNMLEDSSTGAPEGCWYITGCVSCAAELDNCESVPRATHDRNN